MPLDPEFVRRWTAVRLELGQIPFFALVWGPKRTADTPESRKRQRIREDLEKALGPGRVLFSEDPELGEMLQAGKYTAELIQAISADAVVIIPESEGALVESAMYSPILRGKGIAFTTKRPPGGFAGTAYETLKVVEVEPEEWGECERIRREAINWVERLRVEKFLRTSPARFDWQL